jgi:hypothetical protein
LLTCFTSAAVSCAAYATHNNLRLPLTAAIYRIGFYTSPERYRPSGK